ncbi:unnamed protein product [Parnassius apollo]|uniref:(apollo) hypothetical protein n=1 Tax=Parnassius apollo TaxID=110799 RepID=A0A8S3WCA7_PARAO|nr:unnamed protein product [Parnassius apollo]
MAVNIPFLGSICEGCLSIDRRLTAIVEENKLKIFGELLGNLDYISQPLLLCWECTALIKKISRFICQVKTAHDCLVKYMVHQSTNLSPLSTLSKRNADTNIQEFKYDETLISQNLHVPDRILPLTFIKIEDQDHESIDDFYIDDVYDGNEEEEERDNEDLKTVIKSDPFNQEDAIDSVETKNRNSKRKTQIEDFNESDDEPLKLKKKDTELETERVQRKSKKRKKKEEGIKIDRRKHPAPKREKPAGVVTNSRVSKKLQQLNVDSSQLEMVVLSWDEVEEERQRALLSETFTRHEYRCYDCALGFNHRFKLVNHMKKHDPESGPEVCNICKVRCRDAHALCAHRRRHRVRWRCVQCGGAWSRAGVGADHVARAHGAPAPTHRCSVCGHRAPTLGKLRNHIKNHSERQKCDLCGKTFRDRTSLRTHLFIHNGEKEYECPRCGKRFLFKKAMQIHLVTHESSAQVYCYQCDMNFKNQMSYNQHIKYNLKHIDPAKLKYACQLCEKKFVKAKRLEEHNLAVHLKVTPIKCTMPGCSFACSSRPVLRTHVRVLHRNVRARPNHVCDVCGKAYTSKKSLEGHLRAHSGERPFRCVRCPAAFGYEAALYNHNRLVHLKPKIGRGRNAVSDVAAAPIPAVEPSITRDPVEPVPQDWRSIPLPVQPAEVSSRQSTADAMSLK